MRGQTVASAGAETATEDRLADPGWWPTKGSSPRSSFAGDASCKGCHADLFRSQTATPMARAAQPAREVHLPTGQASLSFQNGPYSYLLASSPSAGLVLTVHNGAESETAALGWAFGSGELGQTYVYQKNGAWFESRLSLYTTVKQLDITTGHGRAAPESLHDALGRELTGTGAQRCFACHTTMSTTSAHFEPQSAVAGITCEACHGPGAGHARAMSSSNRTTAQEAALLNPARLSPVDSVDFCGACHRTWADVAFSPGPKTDADTVRFQPYRLEKSRCWGKAGDARITCIACHDPHQPLERDLAAYDGQCLSCHQRHNEAASPGKLAAACPRGTDHCASCHMPKVTVPEMHGSFTDHFIRVVYQTTASAR